VVSGKFTDNEGTSTAGQTPFALGGGYFVFGHVNGGWFKMTAVASSGTEIENRHISPGTVSRISQLTAALWEASNRGGDYHASDIQTGDCPGGASRTHSFVFM
jgi:hypothetical protein